MLADVALQTVLGEAESLKRSGALNDRNGSSALQLILCDSQHLQCLILSEGHSDAFAPIRPKIIVIKAEVLQCLVAHEH